LTELRTCWFVRMTTQVHLSARLRLCLSLGNGACLW
jgi:hypothetical protein